MAVPVRAPVAAPAADPFHLGAFVWVNRIHRAIGEPQAPPTLSPQTRSI
jgi:hypothetical protein